MPFAPGFMQFMDRLPVENVLYLGEQGASRLGKDLNDPTYVFMDGKPRYEIDDSPAKLKAASSSKMMKLGDVIDHPELFQAYPEFADIGVKYDQRLEHGATFDPNNNTITVGNSIKPQQVDDYLGLLLHEIQHSIQKTEDLSPGVNPDYIYSVFGPLGMTRAGAFDAYMGAPGETEARDVQQRFTNQRRGYETGNPALLQRMLDFEKMKNRKPEDAE